MYLTNYSEEKPHYCGRVLWWFVNRTLFYLLIGHPMKRIRNAILRLFGAKIDKDACIYNTCIIFAPWNLKVGCSCIGPHVNLYNKDMIIIGDDSVISQYSYLCTASHDISSKMLPLKVAPIKVDNNAWVAADVFIGSGVTVGEGAVVGARAVVFKDVEPWTVVGGNPAKFIKKRVMKNE